MTALTDFTTKLTKWINRESIDADILVDMVRMGEERINKTLRVREMLTITQVNVTDAIVTLPVDWLELEVVRRADDKAYKFMPRTELLALASTETEFRYSISGNNILLGGNIDDILGVDIEYHYLKKAPALDTTATWLSSGYPSLYLSACLVMASAFGFEDERAAAWDTAMQSEIKELNDAYLRSKASGSRLTRSRSNKSFG